MNKKRMIVSLGLGLLAGLAHFVYVRGLASEQRGGEEISVIAAAKAIGRGDRIEEKILAIRHVPAAHLDDRVIRAEQMREIVGISPLLDVPAGQMLEWSDFAEREGDQNTDLASLVEPGHRAITISVDSSRSMSGLLRPGHRVDILGTFAKGADRGEQVTVTLLQNVRVLATGNSLGGEGEETAKSKAAYSTVTLSVSLEQAELLSLGGRQGPLSIVLRGQHDLEIVRDVPEKAMKDVWESERRNALQKQKASAPSSGVEPIERLRPL